MEGAYSVRGGAEDIPLLAAFLKERGISLEAHTDCFIKHYATFGIAEALDIRNRSALRGFSRSRVFVLVAPSFTQEAQNALLKTFEEPSARALFFLVTPAPDALLPTLRSRMQEISLGAKHADARAFLRAAPSARLEMLSDVLPKKKGEGASEERDISGALALLSGVEKGLFEAGAVNTPEGRLGIRATLAAQKYLRDKGSLMKALLEQVALLVPRV